MLMDRLIFSNSFIEMNPSVLEEAVISDKYGEAILCVCYPQLSPLFDDGQSIVLFPLAGPCFLVGLYDPPTSVALVQSH